VPDYVYRGAQSGRFCIHNQKFTNRSLWDAIRTSTGAVPYAISIDDTDTHATVPVFFPQRTFYESFMASGALDCGPGPSSGF
jgi:hypothetical protein